MASRRASAFAAAPAGEDSPGLPRKVRLLEALLAPGDAPQCASRALAWLHRYAGVRRSVCLVVQPGETLRLAPLAARGWPRRRDA
ncbi:MAG TPA: hypothetical protein VNN07_10715, partial [Candidatus Tectomicrobia bacterium]|nr:hypothetical protein [Candidatus Tectomicrobia bacterium]